jgi:hypothetical protein
MIIFEIPEITKYVFSGHDSFQCRQLWLKKGYDYVLSGKSFNDEDAVIKLGVGKNMVSSIRFWLKAFNVIDNRETPTEFGQKLFDDNNGYDPFLEDDASLWLLHYHLVKGGFASIYNIIFNELRKEKMFFDQTIFVKYVKRISEGNSDVSFNENTVSKDFTVFVNLYKNGTANKDFEDSFSGILSELEILKLLVSGNDKKYIIENHERDNLPESVVLYSILDNPKYGNSISLNALEFDYNSPGSIFALNRSGLVNKISEIVSKHKDVTFTDHAGIKELQFKTKPDPFTILNEYYGK